MTVESGGHVIGDIRAPAVLIHGRVDGTVYALEHLEIAEECCYSGRPALQRVTDAYGGFGAGATYHSVPEKLVSVEERKLKALD